jgi:tetratricopeptide (TPR) repeat protein
MSARQTWTPGAGNRRCLVVGALLLLFTAGLYWPVRDFRFSVYDDQPYIVWNAHVRTGLSWGNAAWAFTTFHEANWHPMTWLSHMADVEAYGLDPGGHHLTNLAFHLANTGMLFALLTALTGALWRSALVAALFAVHPLHVESVAWVAERKDVLSTFLLVATLGAYLRHARRPGSGRLAVVALVFGIGLLAKPMLVTLPFALLLLDWWPLGRVARGSVPPASRPVAHQWRALVFEKLPLFALAAASCVVTVLAQRRGGALQSIAVIPAGQRLANALVSYSAYLVKTAWPSGLGAMYPLAPGGPPLWKTAASAAALGAISWAVVRGRNSRPAAVTGWLWYLGTLVPVIGVVQVGSQARADRYTYVPLIGVFIAVAWVLGDTLSARPQAAVRGRIAVCIVLAGLAATAREQLGYWRDATTLNQRTLAVTGSAWDALMRSAAMHEAHGDLAAAEAAYRRVLEISPDHPVALNNLGLVLVGRGRQEEGIASIRAAIRARPDYAEAFYNLGALLLNQGRLREAVAPFAEALRLKPDIKEAAEARDFLRRMGAPAEGR